MTNKLKDEFYLKVRYFEGYRSKPYKCPAGHLTIGYGHVIKSHESIYYLSLSEAIDLLKRDMHDVMCQLSQYDFVLQEHELHAIADLVFNIGIGSFIKSSLPNLIKRYSSLLDLGLFDAAENIRKQIANKILEFCHYRNPKTKQYEVSKGLLQRRQFEYKLFLEQKIY